MNYNLHHLSSTFQRRSSNSWYTLSPHKDMASAEIASPAVASTHPEPSHLEPTIVDLGAFCFTMSWCACGTPMSCCQCSATTFKECQFSDISMVQARWLHSLHSRFTYEPETLEKFDTKCDISKDGAYVVDIDNPIGNIQLKYKNQGNNIDIFNHKCEKVKEYIFPENPTPEMINLVDRHLRDEIDYPTLIEEFKSTLTCREYNHYDLCITNTFDEMYKYPHRFEFRILYSEDMGWQINTGNGDSTGTMILIQNNEIVRNPCDFWLNPNGRICEMTINGKKII